ncbi:oligosaccharide flippase family protein [Alkalimonas sp.]|uniref:oligosaccharide flippase family protein n=1 Tax=Alkalimonas sp. TaxID=1872453 RepID=UPI00263A55DF|nr:oligosaccharide flippase family protein [Alkalimonas sp.]MCC5827187.1 oligosaccharide flippase family protein [Alkalimonas sp.]
MASLKRALLNSSISSFVGQALALISTIVIARILTPDEIGRYAVISAIAMIFSEFKQLGAGIYLVKSKTINVDVISKAFGLTFIISFFLGCTVLIASYPISYFYGLDGALYIMIIYSLTFFASPFVTIPTALMTREMNFHALRNISILSKVSNLVFSVVFVYLGFSFYSLAIGYLCGFLVQLVMVTTLYSVSSFPVKPKFTGLGSILSLGLYTSAAGFFRKSSMIVPDLIIGKQGNFNDVALFSRGLGFSSFLSQTIRSAISPVSLPYLSKRNREGADLAKDYILGSKLYNALAMPVLFVGAIISLPSIRFLFGPQWDDAAPIASLLMFWAAIKSLNFQFASLMITLDKARYVVIQELGNLVLVALFIAVSFRYSITAASASMLVVAFFEYLYIFFVLNKTVGLTLFNLVKPQIKNFALSFICCLPAFGIDYAIGLGSGNNFIILISVASITPVIWYFSMYILKHELWFYLPRLK